MQFKKWVAYLKISCRTKYEHVETCNDILNDSGATSRDKGIAKQVLHDMEGKGNDEYHSIWYVGETLDFHRRMKQGYPKILERFVVNYRIQVGQSSVKGCSLTRPNCLRQHHNIRIRMVK